MDAVLPFQLEPGIITLSKLANSLLDKEIFSEGSGFGVDKAAEDFIVNLGLPILSELLR
jgi:hypothetical protein